MDEGPSSFPGNEKPADASGNINAILAAGSFRNYDLWEAVRVKFLQKWGSPPISAG